jgi:hypothetical protein
MGGGRVEFHLMYIQKIFLGIWGGALSVTLLAA